MNWIGSGTVVIAYHLIWTVYGYWLPNDPRGSMSKSITSDVIADLGPLHYGRKKIQPSSRVIREFQKQAKIVLNYELLKFQPSEFSIVAEGLADAMRQHQYTCYACAMMPDHVHVILRKHKHQAEDTLENLQKTSRMWLCDAGIREIEHPVWGGSGWKVFLDTPDAIRRTIQYIDENPMKWRLPRQSWPFVQPYDGWPYAKLPRKKP